MIIYIYWGKISEGHKKYNFFEHIMVNLLLFNESGLLYFHMFHPALLRLASSHLVLFQNGDPCPPCLTSRPISGWAGLWPGGKVRRVMGGGVTSGAAPGRGGQCQWSLVAPRPATSRPGPRESRERERQLPVPSEASRTSRGLSVTSAPVTRGDQPQWEISDSVEISGAEKEREARDVSTIGLRVRPAASSEGEHRYQAQWSGGALRSVLSNPGSRYTCNALESLVTKLGLMLSVTSH